MDVKQPMSEFVTVIEDSRRWGSVALRDNDIIIATPPKSGTTWMQGIVSSLLWPHGDAPGTLGSRSPWPDVRFRPLDQMIGELDAQQHRRFIKTHSPADAIPFSESIRYITVYRHAPDAFVSWGNHRATMIPPIMEGLNAMSAADGLDPLPLSFEGDYDELFEEWSQFCSPALHLASWWPLRNRPNVLMLHYADLLADLDGGMRRIADFLDLDVPDDAWPEAVDRCRIGAMRESARSVGGMESGFVGGVDAFFNKGVNGEGARQLSEEQIQRVAEHCAAHLDADALAWLETGSVG